jgi:hypothetical protein
MSSEFNYPEGQKGGGIWSILAAVFLVTTLVLGVLYFLEIRANKALQDGGAQSSNGATCETNAATESKIASDTTAAATAQSDISKLNAQIKTLTTEKDAAVKAKTDAETAKTAAETAKTTAENNLAIANSNKAIAQKYNSVLAYFIEVVDSHDGLAGITDAEYNNAKNLVLQTGDATLKDKLDYVWDEVAVAQIDRIVVFADYIVTKLATKLQ